MAEPIGPGDFVECVDASPGPWGDCGVRLTVGRIYTVEEVCQGAVSPDGVAGDGLILTAPETKVQGPFGFFDAWDIARFRPVRGGSASLITSLLQPAPSESVEA